MKQYTDLLLFAKSHIDQGFSRAGKTIVASDPVHRSLMLLASRAVACGNALMLLALNNHANESLPILRSMLQFAVEMRWITAKDSTKRARDFFEAHTEADWERLWGTAQLRQRMIELHFQHELEPRALMSCTDHLHANAQGLPWGHTFPENAGKGSSSEDVLRAAAAVMGHVLKALQLQWPGQFEGAEHLWEKSEMKSSERG